MVVFRKSQFLLGIIDFIIHSFSLFTNHGSCDESTIRQQNDIVTSLTEQNVIRRIDCAILATRLETNEEITTLKLQLEQMREHNAIQATKIEKMKQEKKRLQQSNAMSLDKPLIAQPPVITPTIPNIGLLTERNIRPLYRGIEDKSVDPRIASLVYWNANGQLVVPISGQYRTSDLIHLFSDLGVADYLPGLLDAPILLEGNCNIFVPYSADHLAQLGLASIFDATRTECFSNDPDSFANLFNQRNILQCLVALDLLQYSFSHSKKRSYAPYLLNQQTTTNIIAQIANIELLPFQPCQMTLFFSIPVKQKVANISGDKKSCPLCSSSAVLEHPKKGELPGKQLRTHIHKTCPLVLLAQQHTSVDKYSLEPETLIKDMLSQLNELDAVYTKGEINLSLVTRYYKFFGHTMLPVPDKFTSCLIDSTGAPYPLANIQHAVDEIIHGRVMDLSLSIAAYKEQHNADLTRLSLLMGSPLAFATAETLRQRVYGSHYLSPVEPRGLAGALLYTQGVSYMVSIQQQLVNQVNAPLIQVAQNQQQPLMLTAPEEGMRVYYIDINLVDTTNFCSAIYPRV